MTGGRDTRKLEPSWSLHGKEMGRNGDFGMKRRVDLLMRKPTAPDCQRRGVFGAEVVADLLRDALRMTRGWLSGLRTCTCLAVSPTSKSQFPFSFGSLLVLGSC